MQKFPNNRKFPDIPRAISKITQKPQKIHNQQKSRKPVKYMKKIVRVENPDAKAPRLLADARLISATFSH
jgi:hypothetical protein